MNPFGNSQAGGGNTLKGQLGDDDENPFAGAKLTKQSPPMRVGNHRLAIESIEFADTTAGPMFFIHFKTLESDTVPAGTLMTDRQNMTVLPNRPKEGKGARTKEMIYGAIASMILPAFGVDCQDDKAFKAACAGPLAEAHLSKELYTKHTIGGAPIAGRTLCATVKPRGEYTNAAYYPDPKAA